jgi:6-pyruvoyl-tetrahydropterin synthase
MTCLFVEHLTVIDCAFLDEQRGLVGESWIVDVELDGALDEQSMVLDFGEVKKRLKRAIDASVDHTLLVPMRSPALSIEEDAAAVALDFRSARGRISHRSPPQALTRLDAETVDAAALSAQLTPILKAVVPASVGALRLALRNELIDGAFHHYTHGLKKHDGHCQRIAHGHRSRIDIRVDGRRDTELEAALARDWRDIYLATREDLRLHLARRCLRPGAAAGALRSAGNRYHHRMHRRASGDHIGAAARRLQARSPRLRGRDEGRASHGNRLKQASPAIQHRFISPA